MPPECDEKRVFSFCSTFDLENSMCRWKGTCVEASVKAAGCMSVVAATPFVVSNTI